MEKTRNTQAIIIICLVIMLVGAVGYLMWANIKSSNGLVNETGTGIQQEHQENEIVNNNQPSEGTVDEVKNPGLTIAQAKTIIENYLKIRGTYQGSPLEMNLLNTKFNMKVDYATTTDDGYVSTNIKYQDFKDVMLKYMTEEMFKTFSYYKNINGILYAFDGGASGMSYTNVELKLVSNANTTYEYNVKSSVNPLEAGVEVKFNVIIEYVNGNYVVGSCNNVSEVSKVPELTITEAKTIVEDYLKIRGTYQGSPLEMNLLNTKFNMKVDYTTITDDGYVSTNIKYQDFKDVMLKYMTEEMFKTFSYYKNINGILYAFDGGASGMSYTDVELKLVSNTNTAYEYNVKSLVNPLEAGVEAKFNVIIEYVNGNYVVSSWKNN